MDKWCFPTKIVNSRVYACLNISETMGTVRFTRCNRNVMSRSPAMCQELTWPSANILSTYKTYSLSYNISSNFSLVEDRDKGKCGSHQGL